MENIPGVILKVNNDDFGIFKINRRADDFKYDGRPLFCPHFKVESAPLPHLEELMNHPERFHHVKYAAHSRDVVSSDTTATIEVEAYNDTDNDFNPKDVQIFDTSMFKSGLRFRETVNERIPIDKDSTRGLASYTDYLRGAKSTPK